MSAADSIEVLAPAKVNLWLDVLGKRGDGYHELDTLLLAVELADTVVLTRVDGPPGQVTCRLTGPHASADVPTGEGNLAVRAARMALDAIGHLGGVEPPAVELLLRKDVPSQAGLGGGSSDAAAAVVGVERLCGMELLGAERAGLLGALGSDCVFFDVARSTGCARAKGRGEVIEVMPAPAGVEGEWWLAILTPEERCSTGEVYGALGSCLSPPPELPTVPDLLGMRASEARVSLRNGLEAAALAVSPGLHRWRDAFVAADAEHFRLAGSGSSFFGLYDTAAEAAAGMARVLAEAQRLELTARGRWVTRSCGHGTRPKGDQGRRGA